MRLSKGLFVLILFTLGYENITLAVNDIDCGSAYLDASGAIADADHLDDMEAAICQRRIFCESAAGNLVGECAEAEREDTQMREVLGTVWYNGDRVLGGSLTLGGSRGSKY